jgi:hypothetical protein
MQTQAGNPVRHVDPTARAHTTVAEVLRRAVLTALPARIREAMPQ